MTKTSLRILLAETSAISAIVAAGFAIATYIETCASSIEMTGVARGIATMAERSQEARDNEQQSLLTQRAMLKTLLRILPQAEQTRLGLERLAKLNARRLKAMRANVKQRRQSSMAPAKRRVPKNIQPSTNRSAGSLQHANRKAEEIWHHIAQRSR